MNNVSDYLLFTNNRRFEYVVISLNKFEEWYRDNFPLNRRFFAIYKNSRSINNTNFMSLYMRGVIDNPNDMEITINKANEFAKNNDGDFYIAFYRTCDKNSIYYHKALTVYNQDIIE